MTITIDWANKLVLSDASITDVIVFKETIREFEDDAEGLLHDPIIAYKRVDLGGGAYFHDVPFINGYQLKFPTPGNYTVIGNIGASIVPVDGVFVDRTKAAAFATVAGEGGGTAPSVAEIVAGIFAQAQVTPIHSNMRQTNDEEIIGDGTPGNRFRSHLVPVDGG